METLEQLKEIVKNAPEGATYHSNSERVYYKFESECWMWQSEGTGVFHFVQDDEYVCDDIRSLSDIKLIIELMEGKKSLESVCCT